MHHRLRLVPRGALTTLALSQLSSIGVADSFMTFKNVSFESEKYITIRETGAQNTLVIVDMQTPMTPLRKQITAESAIMCLDKKVIALKATTAGTPGDSLQIFNLDTKTKLKAHQMPETIEFWKWISSTTLGIVTATAIYHWDMQVRIRKYHGASVLPHMCHIMPFCSTRFRSTLH